VIFWPIATAEVVMAGHTGYVDLSDRYKALSTAGDALERLEAITHFEVFRRPVCGGASAKGSWQRRSATV